MQGQFIDIAASEQHQLMKLLSSIQHNVPQQPSHSYQYLPLDSDDDSDDGFCLTTSLKPSIAAAAAAAAAAVDDDDEEDDDDDEGGNWEEQYDGMSSAADYGGNQYRWSQPHLYSGGSQCYLVSSINLPSRRITETRQEPVKQEQAADVDFTVFSNEDEDHAAFPAFRPKVSMSEQSCGVTVGEDIKPDKPCAADSSSECSDDEDSDDDDDDEWSASASQHGRHVACELKVEGIDDVTDFISDFIPLSTEPSGNILIITNILLRCIVEQHVSVAKLMFCHLGDTDLIALRSRLYT